MQLKISRLYRVGQHGLICSMSNYILIIVLDQRTAFGAFIQPEPESPGCEKEGWDADDLRCYVVMVKQKVGHAFAKVRT